VIVAEVSLLLDFATESGGRREDVTGGATSSMNWLAHREADATYHQASRRTASIPGQAPLTGRARRHAVTPRTGSTPCAPTFRDVRASAIDAGSAAI